MVYIGPPPPQLPPGTPLPGGEGVAGRWLYTWTLPSRIAWQGWLPAGSSWTPPPEWAGVQLQAVHLTPPPDAPPPPDDSSVWTVVRVLPDRGWFSEMA